MKIYVKIHDLGFWTAKPVTVQKFFDGELEYCDHAGAVEETEHVEHPRVDEPDIIYDQELIICDKCPAWRLAGDNYWEETPTNGKHEE